MKQPKLLINLYWHMHQPDYRDSISGEYILPWTYLHVIKDYSDMVYHLEANPKARVSFNFVPILLDQIEDYAAQFKVGKITAIKDPILRLLGTPDLWVITPEECTLIKESCFKSYHEKMLKPFPAYVRLYEMFQFLTQEGNDSLSYLSGQYLADLLTWYHLAWMGESVRQNCVLVQNLMTKGKQFTNEDRQALFQKIGELITDLIPRYKKLAAKGQIEISSTPYHHPILPLLLDFNTTKDAMPYAPMPVHSQYAGGEARAIAHLQDAQTSHEQRFGHKPIGMWPSEGAVSRQSLLVMASQGVQWAASGEGVLANSLLKSNAIKPLISRNDYLYKPYRVQDDQHNIVCFFRDDRLSDKIGFEYQKLHSAEAVADFIRSLEHIHEHNIHPENPVVSIILDGENAWEYYPYNGHYFLTELYQALANHPNIDMVTPSEVLQAIDNNDKNITPKTGDYQVYCGNLPQIAAGSWVYGTFSTWIGSHEKNRGWDLLCEAKLAFDQATQSGALSQAEQAQAETQLAVCEGSDWFWWLGDVNAAQSVTSFDALYRRNLSNLYHLLKLPIPKTLSSPISIGSKTEFNENAGTMRRGTV